MSESNRPDFANPHPPLATDRCWRGLIDYSGMGAALDKTIACPASIGNGITFAASKFSVGFLLPELTAIDHYLLL